jgi:hypothetical protein
MTTFTTLTSSDLDPDSPITTNLANAWYGNPLAIAEDDATAPAFKGRIKAAQLETSFPVSSYAVASGEAVFVLGVFDIAYSGTGGPPYTATITVALTHNGTTIGSDTFDLSSAGAGTKENFTVIGYSTTTATGDLTVSVSGSGAAVPGTLTAAGSMFAAKFVAP